MAKGQYCIVDVTVDGSLALDGLVGLTIEDAQSWIDANQVVLSEPSAEGHTVKYLIQPDNWVDVEE